MTNVLGKDWTSQVISIWTSEGIKLQSGVSVETIASIENLIGFKFPEDFIELYTKVNGFKDYDWTENMFSLWPVERILKEYQENEDSNYVGFCDYLINSHSFGFMKNAHGIFKSYEINNPVCQSFKEIIDAIILNADLIY